MTGGVAAELIRSFVALYLEVEVGLRPTRHLRPLLDPQVQPRVVGGGLAQMPEVRSVLVQVRPDVCEAVVLLDDRGRISALAVSLRRLDEGWRVTEARRPGCPAPTEPAVPVGLTLAGTRRMAGRTAVLPPTYDLPKGWARPAAARRAA